MYDIGLLIDKRKKTSDVTRQNDLFANKRATIFKNTCFGLVIHES